MISLSPTAQAFVDWWHGVRDADDLPPKTAFNSGNMTSLSAWLPLMFLIEIEPDERYVLRYFGFGLTGHFGDLTGENLIDVYPDHVKDRYRQFFQMIYTRPVGGLLSRQIIGLDNTPILQHSLYLPMIDAPSARGFIVGLTERRLDNARFKAGLDRQMDFARVFKEEYLDIGAGMPPAKAFDVPVT